MNVTSFICKHHDILTTKEEKLLLCLNKTKIKDIYQRPNDSSIQHILACTAPSIRRLYQDLVKKKILRWIHTKPLKSKFGDIIKDNFKTTGMEFFKIRCDCHVE
jgi:hypothetical protein